MTWPIIDILKLDSEFRKEKSMFRAIPETLELNEIVEQLIDSLGISNRKFAKEIKVNVGSVHAWCGHRAPKQHPVPLWVLDRLVSNKDDETILRLKINSLINKVRCGRTGKIHNVPKTLTPELAAFTGAHAADGSLSKISTFLDWQLADGDKENVNMVKNWIRDCFHVNLPVNKCRNANAWIISTRIQVIPRFLFAICDMPIGKKDKIVTEPHILKFPETDNRLLTKPSKSQRKELEFWFAKGVMNFDGHCTITGNVPSVGIEVNSIQLLKDLLRIFRENGVKFSDFCKHKKILTTSRKESEKFFNLNCFVNSKQNKLHLLLKNFG